MDRGTQTDDCCDIINKLNEEFSIIVEENDKLKRDLKKYQEINILNKEICSERIIKIFQDSDMIYDSLDISDYPCKDSIATKIIDVMNELTNNENREWWERQVLDIFAKFDFFIKGIRDCPVDYSGSSDMICDYFINELLVSLDSE